MSWFIKQHTADGRLVGRGQPLLEHDVKDGQEHLVGLRAGQLLSLEELQRLQSERLLELKVAEVEVLELLRVEQLHLVGLLRELLQIGLLELLRIGHRLRRGVLLEKQGFAQRGEQAAVAQFQQVRLDVQDLRQDARDDLLNLPVNLRF